MPSLRLLLPWVVALSTVGLLGCAGEGSGRPNVLLITVDTLRADHLTPYGSSRNTSPFLAELAEESVLFRDAIAQCGTTPQSLSSLMTGLYPYTDQILTKNDVFNYLTRDQQTLAVSFREAGYATHAITASIQTSTATGLELGFESFDCVELRWGNHTSQRRTADEVTALAKAWLESETASDRPFFLWLHYMDPHHPYTAPESYAHHFRSDAPTQEGSTERYRFDELRSMEHPLTEGDLERLILDYDREVRFTDDSLRELFASSPQLNGNTLTVFTADHGEALGEHGIITHNDLYDSIVRVPLMIRWPGRLKGGRRSGLPVMLTDIAPTLHELVGFEALESVRGMSLAPWLGDSPRPSAPPRLRRAEYESHSATYDGPLKLIERPQGVELYNRAKDPGELRNVVMKREARAATMVLASRKLTKTPLRPRGTQGAASPGASAAPPEVTEEMLEELRALGYLGAGDEGAGEFDARDTGTDDGDS